LVLAQQPVARSKNRASAVKLADSGVSTDMISRKQLASCAMALGLLLFFRPVSAHHGNAAYDLDKPITLKGTVREFAWSNPHVQIYFDVADAKGKIVHWASETVSPGMLSRAGWTKQELKPGDEIIITLGPAKNGSPVGYVLRIVLADGTELKLGQARDTPYEP
jgi:Family of unknown function (DUF6152)